MAPPLRETTSSVGGVLRRALRDPAFAWRAARFALGLPTRIDTADRRLLEERILPALVVDLRERLHDRATPPDVLFVGVDWYTRHYRDVFAGTTYRTIDPDPARVRFGGSLHRTAGLEALDEWLPPESLDLIVCNGVFGWGLDDREACESAFAACFDCLRPGGRFVFGWNDVPEHRPLEPSSLRSLARFAPWTFPPFDEHIVVVPGEARHTYEFYSRPAK